MFILNCEICEMDYPKLLESSQIFINYIVNIEWKSLLVCSTYYVGI